MSVERARADRLCLPTSTTCECSPLVRCWPSALDVADLPPHLRLAHDLGVPTKVTAELMGHAKVNVTLSAYTQTLADEHAAAAARIGDELFADCSQSGVRGHAEAGLTH